MTVAAGEPDLAQCWCCGQWQKAELSVRLGNHPEVWVCVRCAHFLHQQALAREDALRHSLGAHMRDGLRSARSAVMKRGWHQKPVIGRPLRWLGRHLP
jgi:hypothetical protein